MVNGLQAGTIWRMLLASVFAFARRGAFVLMSQQDDARSEEQNTYLGQRTSDGVTLGLADWGVLGGGQAGEKGNDGGLGEHVGCWWVYYGINA
jgi:hypothetical protein